MARPAPAFLGLLLCLAAAALAAPADQQSAGAREAGELLKAKSFVAAVKAADDAIRADPKDMDARYVRVLAFMRMRRLEDALQDANESLKLAPTQARFWTLRSNVHNLLKRYGPAFNDAEMAMTFDARDAEASVNAAWALDGQGRREESLQALRRAVGYDPGYRNMLEQALKLETGGLARDLAGEPPPSAAPSQPSETGRLRRGLLWGAAAGIPLIAAGLIFAARRKRGPAGGAGEAGSADEEMEAGDAVAGSYQVVRHLGIGGMGVVYEAVDTALQRRVAVKKMRDDIRTDAGERERFLKEARMVASLHHPNIVDIYAVVEDADDAYLVFELVDGKTLSEILKERGRLSWQEALGVCRGAAAALDYAHGQGIVHRDLKPSNIMVDKERRVKVMDFGVARQAKESLTRLSVTNTVVGTPPYMAPEQDQGLVCKGSDVYALGICLYEMLTGGLPFAGKGAAIMLAKMKKSYVPASQLLGGLPAGFDAVLDKALEPDSSRRWQSAGEFVGRLLAL